MPTPTPVEVAPHGTVSFSCASDENASRVHGVLFALGYTLTRTDAVPSARDAALAQVFARFGVEAERERAIARLIVAGVSSCSDLAERLDVSHRTAKALKHTLYARCHVSNAYAFACLVLAQLALPQD